MESAVDTVMQPAANRVSPLYFSARSAVVAPAGMADKITEIWVDSVST